MIALLTGRVAHAGDDGVIVDVAGVGYEVLCHSRAIAELSGADTVTLHIHTAVSDDAIRLYGFPSRTELDVFRHLISVDRIGPKAGLAILSRCDVQTLVAAVVREDAALLATVPGIGRKTAERLVLELRGKLDDLREIPVPGTAVPDAASQLARSAVAILVGLGFREPDARRAVTAVGDGAGDTNDIVASALRELDRSAP